MVRLRIGKLLAERGLNAHAFARLAGLPVSTAYRLVRTKNPPKQLHADTIDKVCEALGVQPGDLFEYIPRKKPR